MTRLILLLIFSVQASRAGELVVENQPAYDPYRVFWSNNDHWLVSKSRRTGDHRCSQAQRLPFAGS